MKKELSVCESIETINFNAVEELEEALFKIVSKFRLGGARLLPVHFIAMFTKHMYNCKVCRDHLRKCKPCREVLEKSIKKLQEALEDG